MYMNYVNEILKEINTKKSLSPVFTSFSLEKIQKDSLQDSEQFQSHNDPVLWNRFLFV